MKHKIIPVAIGTSTIILCALLAGAFIYLSTSAFEDEVSTPGQTVNMSRSQLIQWFQKDYTTPYADIIFQYDQKQVDKMTVNNYEISMIQIEGKITIKELNVLRDCYKNNDCKNKEVSQQVNNIINNYTHSIVKDDIVIVYGLIPSNFIQASGYIDSHIFIIGDVAFADIVNPIALKMNKKYANRSKEGIINMAEMEREAWVEILEEQTPEMLADLKLLEKSAQSVKLVSREE